MKNPANNMEACLMALDLMREIYGTVTIQADLQDDQLEELANKQFARIQEIVPADEIIRAFNCLGSLISSVSLVQQVLMTRANEIDDPEVKAVIKATDDIVESIRSMLPKESKVPSHLH